MTSSTNRIVQRIQGREFADTVIAVEGLKKEPLPYRESFCERLTDVLIPKEPKPSLRDKPIETLRMIEMPFGQHVGQPLAQVPLKYLEWLVRSQEEFYRDLRAYLRHPETRHQMAMEGIGEDV